jgi:hypothetical protein
MKIISKGEERGSVLSARACKWVKETECAQRLWDVGWCRVVECAVCDGGDVGETLRGNGRRLDG